MMEGSAAKGEQPVLAVASSNSSQLWATHLQTPVRSAWLSTHATSTSLLPLRPPLSTSLLPLMLIIFQADPRQQNSTYLPNKNLQHHTPPGVSSGDKQQADKPLLLRVPKPVFWTPPLAGIEACRLRLCSIDKHKPFALSQRLLSQYFTVLQ